MSNAQPATQEPFPPEVFVRTAQPTCATCHTLGDAGTPGAMGPSLDVAKATP